MASILDHQSDIPISGELDARYDITGVCDVDRILDIIANETFSGLWCERIATLIEKNGTHDRRR